MNTDVVLKSPNYNDPEDKSEKIFVSRYIDDAWESGDENYMFDIIYRFFPGWIQHRFHTEGFSHELQCLQDNWNSICEICKTEKKDIVLVTCVSIDKRDNNHELLRKASDKLTQFGFLVRMTAEFQQCNKCSAIIFTKPYHDQFIKSREYSGLCSSCS